MKCLIVEDNLVLRLEYVQTLEMHGYECSEAGSVDQALYLLKTHDFLIILLDLLVTDGSSLPLVDYAEAMGLTAPIVLITGSGAFPRGESVNISPRIDYVLRKPINLDDLTAVVDYLASGQG